jgi:hypothetical protein
MKSVVAVFITLVIIIGVLVFVFEDRLLSTNQPVSQCKIDQVTYYYLDTCGSCQQFKDSGIIEKLEKLGVKVQEINAAVGPIRHKFESVPTFAIGDNIYSGPMSFEQLSKILGCPESTPSPSK